MKFLKIAVPSVILLSVLTMGGCATSDISIFQKVSPSENNKVTISLPVFTEENMETKKIPNVTEKIVLDKVFTNLKENLNRKGLLADRESAPFGLDLRVHYYLQYFIGGAVRGEAQGLMVQATLKGKNGSVIAQVDSRNGTGFMWDYQNLTTSVSEELANQIEKILKEGVNVGKSP